MTTALLESPLDLFSGSLPFGPPRGRRTTLEERLDATWRAVQAEGRAQCPVCGAGMQLDHGVGRCGGCGSQLS